MSTLVELVMGDLIDEALDQCHRYSERAAQVVMGSTALASATDTLLTLSEGAASPTDVLEFGQELLLVTAKNADASPVYTVARGYLNTTPNSAISTGELGGLNPLYPRYQVQRAIERCMQRLGRYVPCIASDTFLREEDSQFVVLESDVVRVLEVAYISALTSRYTEIGGWSFVDDLPSGVAVSGKLLRVPSAVPNDLELIVKYQTPYAWSATPATETSVIEVPLGGEDLPVQFAVARLVSGREVSRSELDKVEEWNHEAALRGGVNLRLLQMLWADYYHTVDEVRSTVTTPKHRPYRRMPRVPRRSMIWR